MKEQRQAEVQYGRQSTKTEKVKDSKVIVMKRRAKEKRRNSERQQEILKKE